MYPDRGTGLHERIVGLDRKFTGGGNDENMYFVLLVFWCFPFNAREDRKAECEGLATDICSVQEVGN